MGPLLNVEQKLLKHNVNAECNVADVDVQAGAQLRMRFHTITVTRAGESRVDTSHPRATGSTAPVAKPVQLPARAPTAKPMQIAIPAPLAGSPLASPAANKVTTDKVDIASSEPSVQNSPTNGLPARSKDS